LTESFFSKKHTMKIDVQTRLLRGMWGAFALSINRADLVRRVVGTGSVKAAGLKVKKRRERSFPRSSGLLIPDLRSAFLLWGGPTLFKDADAALTLVHKNLKDMD